MYTKVLSESASKAIMLTGGEAAAETAQFVHMVDQFFDVMNVHIYTDGLHAIIWETRWIYENTKKHDDA